MQGTATKQAAWQQFLKESRKPKSWATQLHIEAAAAAYGIDRITIYSTDYPSYYHPSYEAPNVLNDPRHIELAYTNHNHYVLVKDTDQANTDDMTTPRTFHGNHDPVNHTAGADGTRPVSPVPSEDLAADDWDLVPLSPRKVAPKTAPPQPRPRPPSPTSNNYYAVLDTEESDMHLPLAQALVETAANAADCAAERKDAADEEDNNNDSNNDTDGMSEDDIQEQAKQPKICGTPGCEQPDNHDGSHDTEKVLTRKRSSTQESVIDRNLREAKERAATEAARKALRRQKSYDRSQVGKKLAAEQKRKKQEQEYRDDLQRRLAAEREAATAYCSGTCKLCTDGLSWLRCPYENCYMHGKAMTPAQQINHFIDDHMEYATIDGVNGIFPVHYDDIEKFTASTTLSTCTECRNAILKPKGQPGGHECTGKGMAPVRLATEVDYGNEFRGYANSDYSDVKAHYNAGAATHLIEGWEDAEVGLPDCNTIVNPILSPTMRQHLGTAVAVFLSYFVDDTVDDEDAVNNYYLALYILPRAVFCSQANFASRDGGDDVAIIKEVVGRRIHALVNGRCDEVLAAYRTNLERRRSTVGQACAGDRHDRTSVCK